MQRRVWRKLQMLESRPDAGIPLVSAEDPAFGRLWRLRVGDYRIIYAVNDRTRRVTLVAIGHRRSAYRSLD